MNYMKKKRILVLSWGQWHDRESNKDKATLQILVRRDDGVAAVRIQAIKSAVVEWCGFFSSLPEEGDVDVIWYDARTVVQVLSLLYPRGVLHELKVDESFTWGDITRCADAATYLDAPTALNQLYTILQSHVKKCFERLYRPRGVPPKGLYPAVWAMEATEMHRGTDYFTQSLTQSDFNGGFAFYAPAWFFSLSEEERVPFAEIVRPYLMQWVHDHTHSICTTAQRAGDASLSVCGGPVESARKECDFFENRVSMISYYLFRLVPGPLVPTVNHDGPRVTGPRWLANQLEDNGLDLKRRRFWTSTSTQTEAPPLVRPGDKRPRSEGSSDE